MADDSPALAAQIASPALPRGWWAALLRRRWQFAGLAAVALLLALAGLRMIEGPRVPVETVVQRDFVQSVVTSGHVQAPHRVSLGSQVVGTVKRVPVDEGQVVIAGQVLIVLEHTEAQAALLQAEVAVQQAQARLRQLREVQAPVAQATLQQAEVTQANARLQWQRSRDLFRQGFIGQAALDEARKAVDLAEAQVLAARSQFEAAQPDGSDAAIASAALAQASASADAARSRLGYTQVAAPVAGTLIARDVEPGDVVQPGKALMVLSPAGATELVVQIDEKNLHLLAVGQPAQASADAYPEQRFAATVSYINPGVDAQRGSVEVKLSVARPPAFLRQDMTVSVDIRTAERPQALLLPLAAVHEPDSSQPWVLRVDGGRAKRQAVRLGLRSGGQAELLAGLRAGDQVVPASVATLREGDRLRPLMSPVPRVAP